MEKRMMREIAKNMTSLMTAAFGLVAALAWNAAIMSAFKDVFGTASTTVPEVVYAVVVTLIAVVVIFYVSKLDSKLGNK